MVFTWGSKGTVLEKGGGSDQNGSKKRGRLNSSKKKAWAERVKKRLTGNVM